MNIRKILRPLMDRAVVPLVDAVGPLRSLFTYVGRSVGRDGYRCLRRAFIANGDHFPGDGAFRRDLIRRFEMIDRSFPPQTTPTDGLFLAEALWNCRADGDVVECGCFNGTSTAKLSLVCKEVGRQLHVFDSFEGLPEGGESAANKYTEYSLRRASEGADWFRGSFSAGLETVQENVRRYGCLEVCNFHRGWFKDTLTPGNVPQPTAFAFTDVDLPSSARECLVGIWPHLSDGGVYFSHDFAFLKVLETLHDESLWREILGEYPPVFYGAGTGLVDASPMLGFAVKGANVTPEYTKSLMIVKNAGVVPN